MTSMEVSFRAHVRDKIEIAKLQGFAFPSTQGAIKLLARAWFKEYWRVEYETWKASRQPGASAEDQMRYSYVVTADIDIRYAEDELRKIANDRKPKVILGDTHGSESARNELAKGLAAAMPGIPNPKHVPKANVLPSKRSGVRIASSDQIGQETPMSRAQIAPDIVDSVMGDDEFFLGAVRGVRFYDAERGCEFLKGGWSKRWYSPRQKARCNRKHPTYDRDSYAPLDLSGPPPHAPCRCGINMYAAGSSHMASNAISRVFGSKQRGYRNGDKGVSVIGLTEGWGKVIVHADGYRCEQALVTTVIYNSDSPFSPRWLSDGWSDVRFIGVNRYADAKHHIDQFCCTPQLSAIPAEEMVD